LLDAVTSMALWAATHYEEVAASRVIHERSGVGPEKTHGGVAGASRWRRAYFWTTSSCAARVSCMSQ